MVVIVEFGEEKIVGIGRMGKEAGKRTAPSAVPSSVERISVR